MFDGDVWWVIFPIIGLAFMVLMMSRMLGIWSRRSGHRTGMGPMRMGPMCGMSGNRHREPDDAALEELRKRYAAGELTDDEFDTMRHKLEGR